MSSNSSNEPKRPKSKRVKRVYIQEEFPSSFNFQVNTFANDKVSRSKRQKILSQNPYDNKNVVIYNDKVEYYADLPNSVKVPLEGCQKSGYISRYTKEVFFELHGDKALKALIDSKAIQFIKNKGLQITVMCSVSELDSINAKLVNKRLITMKLLKTLILPNVTCLDLGTKYLDPTKLQCPKITNLTLSESYRGIGNFTKKSFPNIETLQLKYSKIVDFSLDFSKLKNIDLSNTTLENFTCSPCPELESLVLCSTLLKEFEAHSYFPKLRLLDVSANGYLKRFSLGNAPELLDLRFDRCQNLSYFGEMNAPKLIALSMVDTGSNSSFSLEHTKFVDLKSLKVPFSGVTVLPRFTPSLAYMNAFDTKKLEKFTNHSLKQLIVLDISRSTIKSIDIKVSDKFISFGLQNSNRLKYLSVDSDDLPRDKVMIANKLMRLKHQHLIEQEVQKMIAQEKSYSKDLESFIKAFDTKNYFHLIIEPYEKYFNTYNNPSFMKWDLLDDTGFKLQFPELEEIGMLKIPMLRHLKVECTKLKSFGRLESVTLMSLNICNSSLSSIGKCRVPNLRNLKIKDTPIEDISSLLSSHMISLDISNAKVKSIDDQILEELEEIRLENLENFTDLSLPGSECLRELILSNCPKLKSLEGVNYSTTLSCENCSGLQTVNIECPNLKRLIVKNSPMLMRITENFTAPVLDFLRLENCDAIKVLDLSKSKYLQKIELISLKSMREWKINSSLKRAHLEDIAQLSSLPPELKSLWYLKLIDCPNVCDAGGMFSDLRDLRIVKCDKLTVKGLKIPKAHNVKLISCSEFTGFASITLSDLKTFSIEKCPKITNLDLNAPNLENLKLLDCESLESFNQASVTFNRLDNVSIRACPLNIINLQSIQETSIAFLTLSKLDITSLEIFKDYKIKTLTILDCEALTKISTDCLPSLTDLTIASKSFAELDADHCRNLEVVRISSPVIREVCINKDIMKNIREVKLQNCAVRKLEFIGSFYASLQEVSLLGTIYLKHIIGFRFKNCSFVGRLGELEPVFKRECQVEFLGVLNEMVLSQLKSLINLRTQKQVFDSDRESFKFLSNGLLDFDSYSGPISEKPVTFLCDHNYSSHLSLDRFIPTYPLKEFLPQEVQLTEEDFCGAFELFKAINEPYKYSHLFNTNSRVTMRCFMMLYLLLNLEKPNSSVFSPILGESELWWVRTLHKMTQQPELHGYKELASNLRKVLIDQLGQICSSDIRQKILAERNDITEADMESVKFTLSKSALEFLSGNVDKLTPLNCGICLDDEPSHNLQYCFFVTCGHSSCSECIKEVMKYHSHCFSCRADISSGFVEERFVIPEVNLYRKLDKDVGPWNESSEKLRNLRRRYDLF